MSDANWLQKDVFVEVDAMAGRAPSQETLRRVVEAFDPPGKILVPATPGLAGGLPNVRLHIQTSPAHLALPLTNGGDYDNAFVDFQADKGRYFGTPAERANPSAAALLAAKRQVYRYCIFANTHSGGSSSGLAERGPSDDFMVTLGSVGGGTPDEQAGTFMHELGHTLGLGHGGVDGILWKPNYYSVMNYFWQMPKQWHGSAWGLRYSESALDTLDENSLDEERGVGFGLPGVVVPYRHNGPFLCPYTRFSNFWGVYYNPAPLGPGDMVDWNGDCSITPGLVSGDINNFSERLGPHAPAWEKALDGLGKTKLVGSRDWDHLRYNFRTSPAFAPGVAGETVGCDYDETVHAFLDSLYFSCPIDLTGDGVVDFGDYLEFLNLFDAQDSRADLTGDGVIDFGDYLEFLNQFEAGC